MIKKITGKVLICVLIITVGVLINTELHAQDQEQDTVYLKNGSIIRGDITELIPSKEVKIQTKDGSLFVYDFKEVEKIETKKIKEAKPSIKQVDENISEKKSTVIPNRFTGNLNLFLGNKILDKDDWEPFEEHTEFGVLTDFKMTNWPVSMTINLLHSMDDGLYRNVKIDFTTTELNLGVLKIWDNYSIVRPFVGGGLTLIKTEAKLSAFGESTTEDDTGVGIWIEAGVYFTLAKHFNLGLNGRWSKAEVSMLDNDLEAGGWHYGMILGYHW